VRGVLPAEKTIFVATPPEPDAAPRSVTGEDPSETAVRAT
jgi:hypothetical protein